jgi:hypothetical protein
VRGDSEVTAFSGKTFPGRERLATKGTGKNADKLFLDPRTCPDRALFPDLEGAIVDLGAGQGLHAIRGIRSAKIHRSFDVAANSGKAGESPMIMASGYLMIMLRSIKSKAERGLSATRAKRMRGQAPSCGSPGGTMFSITDLIGQVEVFIGAVVLAAIAGQRSTAGRRARKGRHRAGPVAKATEMPKSTLEWLAWIVISTGRTVRVIALLLVIGLIIDPAPVVAQVMLAASRALTA